MKNIRLSNYRCFDDTGTLRLARLNFFVGANNSGKSSILKFFPLIKQSVGILRNGMLLWNGNWIDFQSLSNVQKHRSKMLVLEFSIDVPSIMVSGALKHKSKSFDVCIHLGSYRTYFDRLFYLRIRYDDQCIEIWHYIKEGVKIAINGRLYSDLDSNLRKEDIHLMDTLGLLPTVMFTTPKQYPVKASTIAANRLHSIESNVFGRRPAFFYSMSEGLPGRGRIEATLRQKKPDIDENDIETINDLCVYYRINNIIDSINAYIANLSLNISYIGPLRLRIDRYMRVQNSAVQDVEPDGSNLVMFLMNLSVMNFQRLNSWLTDVFDCRLQLAPQRGNVELKLSYRSAPFRNMVDLGMGFSEIIPILVLIWKSIYHTGNLAHTMNPRGKSNCRIIVVEQPELHLHPRLQGQVAEVLVNVTRKCVEDGLDVKFIIETHSETILNVIGEAVEFGKLSEDDVNVFLFEKDGGNATVRMTSYDEEGCLKEWPMYFFDSHGFQDR